MKIAITSLYLPSGSKIGVGYAVHAFANALVQRGHDVTVFSRSGASPDSLYRVEIVPVGPNLRTFAFAWNLRRHDWSSFDVLHCHGDDWFLWGCNRPRHIHTFHGSCLAEMLHAGRFREKLRMGMLAICELATGLLADETVAVSQNTRRYNPFVRSIIPNGVDLSAFRPDGSKSDAPSLLFVGSMHARKRGAMLLRLFHEEIRPQLPNAEFWAVCDEPVEGDGVHWFGRVSSEQLAELYRHAWAFCLPSTYEGFGIPYIEAMASGTPVVATNNPGAIEVTANGRYGLLATDASLGQNLLQVLTDSALRLRMAAGGLERACHYSWERVCADYENLYRSPQLEGAVA